MPVHVGDSLIRLALQPLHLAATPYRKWSERRLLAREIQEAQRNIAIEANEDFNQFHEMLWNHWPDAVEHVRKQVRREENSHDE
ncbi:MAG: hypothetical protein ACXWOL_05295 [Ktedonobacteraceae bacterium]